MRTVLIRLAVTPSNFSITSEFGFDTWYYRTIDEHDNDENLASLTSVETSAA